MNRRLMLLASIAFVLLSAAALPAAGPFPKFKTVTIDPKVGNVCYAVTVADVNGDKKPDIVAVTENRVIWYENPSWKKHVILENQTVKDNVCIAPLDIDRDGKVDFAVGAGWPKSGGTIQWITRGKPGEKWKVHAIGREPWLHRMRFADVLGKGRPQLVISPLNKTTGKGVRLTAFEISKNPKTDRWPRHLMDATLDGMHNHVHVDFNRDGIMDTFTASRNGIHYIRRKKGTPFKTSRIGTGLKGKTPAVSGAGEIKVGKLKSGQRFIATIQPMHGHMLVVNIESKSGDRVWTKKGTLAKDLVRGHALGIADFDGDGNDDILVGHSNTKAGPKLPRGVYVFTPVSPDGSKWRKHVIDEGGIAVEDAIVADFNGDGKPDIVAGGRYTHNVKLYVNLGR